MIELIQGDCITEMRKLIGGGRKVDLILTDPPYGTTHCKWDSIIPFKDMWDCINQLIYDNTPIILFGNEPFSSHLRLSNLKNYKYDIIWDKIIRTGFLNANRQPLRQYENIIIFYNKQCYYNPIKWEGEGPSHPHTVKKTRSHNVYNASKDHLQTLTKWKYPTNIYQCNSLKDECNNAKRVHPTQKPVKLLEYLIKTYSQEGDTVLDFTMGSGSTGVACNNTNRNFIGIELDEDYYNIAVERCKDKQLMLDKL